MLQVHLLNDKEQIVSEAEAENLGGALLAAKTLVDEYPGDIQSIKVFACSGEVISAKSET